MFWIRRSVWFKLVSNAIMVRTYTFIRFTNINIVFLIFKKINPELLRFQNFRNVWFLTNETNQRNVAKKNKTPYRKLNRKMSRAYMIRKTKRVSGWRHAFIRETFGRHRIRYEIRNYYYYYYIPLIRNITMTGSCE